MSEVEGLSIIGESINDSIPKVNALFDARDFVGIQETALFQQQQLAWAIDINVGRRPPAFMAEVVAAVQESVSIPVAIDTPDIETARAGLSAYDCQKAGGRLPVLNSIAPGRTDMFSLYGENPFVAILLASERRGDGNDRGSAVKNATARETYATAEDLLALAARHGIPPHHCLIDVGIGPVAVDTDNATRRTFESIDLIGSSLLSGGAGLVLGLSNFTHMLPYKRPSDGFPVRSLLESAVITMLLPRGLSTIIGSVRRKYMMLDDDHPAMRFLETILAGEGYDTVYTVQQFISV